MSSGGTLQGLLRAKSGADDFEESMSRETGLACGSIRASAAVDTHAWWAEAQRTARKPFATPSRWCELLFHNNFASLVRKAERQYHYGFDQMRPYCPMALEAKRDTAKVWKRLHELLRETASGSSTHPGVSASAEFARLAENWKAETAHLSSITRAAMHPAYQRIVGMGSSALPLILCELRDRPRQWFWALKAISGEDPVKPEDRGNVPKMREAWLEWGRKRGHIR